MQELALGQLTLNQAEKIFSLIEARRRLLETQELERRMRALEERIAVAVRLGGSQSGWSCSEQFE